MAEASHAGIENKLSLRGISEKVVQKAKKVGALSYLLGTPNGRVDPSPQWNPIPFRTLCISTSNRPICQSG
jgi:hypothetical protein